MKIKDGFKLREVCGKNVISGESFSQINFSKLIVLNDTACYLWKEVQGKDFDAETLTNLLLEKYGIPEETAKDDAQTLLGKWIENGLVE